MKIQDSLRFDTIQLIDALRPGDLKTTAILLDEIEPLGLVSKPTVTCRLSRVADRSAFEQTLTRIESETRIGGRCPIIHIDAHGDRDGVQLPSREFVPWEHLRDVFTAINRATRMNLLVFLAACEGAHLVSLLRPTDRAPVRALIGPTRQVKAGEVERAIVTFYRSLFVDGNARTAWLSMNRVVDPGETTFAMYPAEFLLCTIFNHYLRSLCSEEALNARQHTIEQQLRREGIPESVLVARRQHFRTYQRDHRRHFEHTKSHFLFLDEHPELATRFPVSFDECVSDPPLV